MEAATWLHGGDRAPAVAWLEAPNRGLGDRRPMEMVVTQPGYERAMDLIGALEEGLPPLAGELGLPLGEFAD